MKRRARILTVLVCICFLLASAFSVLLLMAHTGHHCTGEQCESCVLVANAAKLMDQLRTALLPFMAALTAVGVAMLAAEFGAHLLPRPTPVSLKIQLNN